MLWMDVCMYDKFCGRSFRLAISNENLILACVGVTTPIRLLKKGLNQQFFSCYCSAGLIANNTRGKATNQVDPNIFCRLPFSLSLRPR